MRIAQLKGQPSSGLKELLVLEKTLLRLRLAIIIFDRTVGTKEQKLPKGSEMEELIISLLRQHGQIGNQELLATLPITASKRNVKRYLARLVQSGRIVRKMVNNNQTHYALAENPVK